MSNRRARNPVALVAIAAVILSGMAVAHGHGQRVIAALVGVSTEDPPTFEITYSFDVAMLFDGAVPVDRAWVNSQPKGDLEAIAADTEEYLTGMVSWRFGGDEVSGMFAFPDFAHLPDPDYDNGEPEGHIRVIYSGALPGTGGDFDVSLGDEAPFGVFTTRVDGKTKRRPAVLVGGESKTLVSLAGSVGAVEAPPPDQEDQEESLPEDDGAGAAAGAVDEGGVDPALFDLEEGVSVDDSSWETAWIFVKDGLRHVFSDGLFHWVLGLSIFLLGQSWRRLLFPLFSLALGALLTTWLQPAWGAGWTQAVGWGGVVALAGAALGASRQLPWCFWLAGVIAFVTGAVHAGGGMAWILGVDLGQVELSGFWAGVELGHLSVVFLGFVLLGWGWGERYYTKRIITPGVVVVVLVSIFALLSKVD